MPGQASFLDLKLEQTQVDQHPIATHPTRLQWHLVAQHNSCFYLIHTSERLMAGMGAHLGGQPIHTERWPGPVRSGSCSFQYRTPSHCSQQVVASLPPAPCSGELLGILTILPANKKVSIGLRQQLCPGHQLNVMAPTIWFPKQLSLRSPGLESGHLCLLWFEGEWAQH